LHPTNRGVGLYDDKVYMTSTDACVTALSAATGKVAWDHCVAPWKDGYYITLSPMVQKDKVLVGVSGGEFGIRGFIMALDAQTGKELWKTYTVAGPDDPQGNSWKGDSWKTGGGPVWVQGSYDPKTNLVYFGTGNGGPWSPDVRPGDNLYTTSAIALDLDTGKIKGWHQYHYNDAWDWDEVSTPILIDVAREGRTFPAAVHAGRDGYLWILERKSDGALNFVDGKPFVYQNVFKSIDPKTGRPTYDETKVPHLNVKSSFCPGLWGGKDWPPEAYNPDTKLLYVPANENLCATITDVPVGERKPGELYVGVPIEGILNSLEFREGVDVSKPVNIGQLQAWDLNTGKKVWSHDFQDSALWGPVLTTGGGLVFAGGTSDRMFRAFDAKTGDVLWQTKLNTGVIGVPVSYQVDGVQYIAVQAGWGVDADRMLGGINKLLPEDRQVKVAPQGGVVWVFKVSDQLAVK
jgi:alcohol dehydrogenase (cytochrome c)